jgi:hypothetical protein
MAGEIFHKAAFEFYRLNILFQDPIPWYHSLVEGEVDFLHHNPVNG